MLKVPLKKKHNTKIFKVGLSTVVRLYNTDIVNYDAVSRRLVLTTGGWETMTTRHRMREALEEIFDMPFGVWGDKGRTVLRFGGVDHYFIDGRLDIILPGG